MSKTKNWLMDQEEEFYSIADGVIGECEELGEFVTKMQHHSDKVEWTLDQEVGERFEDLCGDLWSEYWSKYL